MKISHLSFATALLCAIASLPTAAQDWPTRPIRIIVPQGPGGLSDVFTRALGEELGPALGQTLVVENKVGAAGSLGAKACADSAPDGYTLCVLNNESMAINPWILKNVKFDPKKDVTPITRFWNLQQVFAINASLNVKSFSELAALAKSKPKTMTYLAPSLAKVAFMERFNKQYGVDFVRVPFKGGGDAVNSMLSGVTPVAIFGIGNLIQFINNGQIIGLAVDGNERSPLAPQIPTFKEAGFTLDVWSSAYSLLAPAGTPKPILDRVHKAVVKIGKDPEFQKRFIIPRGLTPVFDTPEHFAKVIEEELAIGLDVVKASGLYPEIQ
ncbi:MAG TPA: tripartite tricarboxylate transporter substrate binding protein [Xanthobacteraceae bacterium]|nr:tripartite tricarboxylate transporter substrate binding protein [Xanthobacteraceae bacterium]